MTATTHIHPVNAVLSISRPESSFAENPTSGISGKEIQKSDIRSDPAAIQLPQAITEQETDKDERSQTEASIAV